MLATGGAILVAMIGAVLYSTLRGEDARRREADRLEFAYSPPHPPILQRVLSEPAVRDQVTGQSAFLFGLSTDTVLFTSVPPVTARPGRPYRYVPRPLLPVDTFGLRGAPPGLRVDPVTGEITGVPEREGRFDVVLTGRLQSGEAFEHAFPLFVDSRLLLLGSDHRGRSVGGRIADAMRHVLLPGLIAVLIGVGGGVLLGALGGYYGGAAGRVMTMSAAAIEAVPGLLVLYLAAAVSAFDSRVIMAVVGLILLPETAKAVGERVEQFRRTDFVEAARELGLRSGSVLWGEIVWYNLRPLIIARTAQAFSYAILADVTLSYLDLSNPDTPALGRLLKEGRMAVAAAGPGGEHVPWLVIAPGAALLLAIAGFSCLERGAVSRWERGQ